jgi:hypothetical protein
MSLSQLALDKREPRGIIIRAGAPKRTRMPFWAYCWSEDVESGACAAPRGRRILDSAPTPDGSTQRCRASP